MKDDSDAIWRAIAGANQAWLRGDPAATAPLFAPDVVAVPPDLGATVRGRDAMVQSFVDYVAQVKTHHFTEGARSIEVLGDVAVATYRFDVRYEVGGAIHDEVGQEVLVLTRTDGQWRVIWRTQLTVR